MLKRWEAFTRFLEDGRICIIIDEALTGVVEENRVTLEGLRLVLAVIPEEVRQQHGGSVKALQKLEQLLASFASVDRCLHRLVWDDASEKDLGIEVIDLDPLRTAAGSLPLDRLVLHKDSDADRRRLKLTIDETLKDAQALFDRWAVYSRKGKKHTMNNSLLLIPDTAPPAVVLDATAKQSEFWEILGSRAVIPVVPQDARLYANVTLHVARANAMGKNRMKKEASVRFPRLIKNLEEPLGPDRKVFVCTHKAVEHVAQRYSPSSSVTQSGIGERSTAGTTGKTATRRSSSACRIVTRSGPTTSSLLSLGMKIEGLQDPKWKKYEDVRRMMQQRQMSVSVIQAINRVRCRRVVDENGNCHPTDVFIVLPEDVDGDAILDAIRQEMPGIKVVDWEFEPDGERARVRKGSSHEALLSLMTNRLPGETSMSHVQAELELTRSGTKELRRVLKDPSHGLTHRLKSLGVNYVVRGEGRGSKSYLLKAA